MLRPLQTYGEWFAVGLQAAIEAVEHARATIEAKRLIPEPVEVEEEAEDQPEPGSLQYDQLERVAKIEEIEAEMECRLTRQQVFNLELSGVFGERWASRKRSRTTTSPAVSCGTSGVPLQILWSGVNAFALRASQPSSRTRATSFGELRHEVLNHSL